MRVHLLDSSRINYLLREENERIFARSVARSINLLWRVVFIHYQPLLNSSSDLSVVISRKIRAIKKVAVNGEPDKKKTLFLHHSLNLLSFPKSINTSNADFHFSLK